MTPEQVAALKALVEVIRLLAGFDHWGAAMTLAAVVVIGPWVVCILLMWAIERGQSKRLTAAIAMYEHNVELVKDYAEAVKTMKRIAEDQLALATKSTAVLQEMVDNIRTNQYCPAARVTKVRQEVKGE
ncbi:MAG: hypothetical protein AB1896_22290 [Thermodesulfobacteriota bacterium]